MGGTLWTVVGQRRYIVLMFYCINDLLCYISILAFCLDILTFLLFCMFLSVNGLYLRMQGWRLSRGSDHRLKPGTHYGQCLVAITATL